MNKLILIKYGELTTKKANRNFFIRTLEKNIKNILCDDAIEIKKDRVRMYIKTNNNIENVVKKLQKVFGIHGIVICYQVDNNIDSMKKQILEILKDKEFKTFKINAKRADKTFPIHTMELNNIFGGFVLQNIECRVDVHNPDITINIEVRPEGTAIYIDEIKGAGGYPVGIQGKGLLMLSGGIDSPVAGYLALKRGVDIECLYFESPPHTSIEAKNKVLKLASILNEYSGNIRVHIVPFTKIQEEIYKNVKDNYIITIMRRMMYRIASEYSKRKNFKIIINGESIGQVASQTLDSMIVINNVTNLPVIRPVACLDKLEIIEIANKIGTYETSILPYEDCCTIFLPKHPVINPSLDKCLLYEHNFNYEELIENAINNIEVITNFSNDYKDIL